MARDRSGRLNVSTHSRPKAAGLLSKSACKRAKFQLTAARRRLVQRSKSHLRIARFNSQPPEGGWAIAEIVFLAIRRFNSQPPEGGWAIRLSFVEIEGVSTHSRPKAAGSIITPPGTRPKVSTHSRPKAAGQGGNGFAVLLKFQLTAARRRLASLQQLSVAADRFQLTAARRRLVPPLKPLARKACIALFR